MGCKSSTAGGEDNSIKCVIKPTKIQSADNFFDQCRAVLEKAESLRSSFDDPRDKMHEISNTKILVTPTLKEAIQAWLISCWVQVDNLNFEFTENFESPYIQLSSDSFEEDNKTFRENLFNLLKALKAAPKEVQETLQELTKLQEQGKELSNNLKSDAQSAGLNMTDTMLAMKNCGANLLNLGKGISKLTVLKETLENTLKDLKSVKDGLGDLKTQCKQKAEAARKEGKAKLPKETIYLTDAQKKSPKQIEDEEKKVKAVKEKQAKNKEKEQKSKDKSQQQQQQQQQGHSHGTGPGQHQH